MSESVAPVPPSRRRWPRWLVLVVGVLILVPLLAVGTLALALRDGSVSLGVLRPYLADLVAARVGGGTSIDVTEAELQHTPRGLELHLKDIILKDRDRRSIVSAPDAVLTFELGQLVRLDPRPSAIVLQGVVFDGGTRHAAAAGSPTVASDPLRLAQVQPLLAMAARFIRDSRDIDLTALALDDARVTVQPPFAGAPVTISNIDMRISGGRGAPLQLHATGDSMGGRLNATITAKALSDDRYEVAAELKTALAPLVSILADGAIAKDRITGQATGEAKIAFLADGTAVGGSGRIALQDVVALNVLPDTARMTVDGLSVDAEWNGGPERIDRLRWQFAGEGHRFGAEGPVRLATASDPWHRFDGTGRNWTLAGVGSGDPAVVADTVALPVAFAADGSEVRVDGLTVQGPLSRIALNASAQFPADGPHVKISLNAGPMPGRTMLSWWPAPVAAPARRFLVNNLVEGEVRRLEFTLDLPPAELRAALANKGLPRETFRMTGQFENAAMKVIEGLPPLSGLVGTARVDAVSGDGLVGAGQLVLGPNRRLLFRDGQYELLALDTEKPRAGFRFQVQAPLEHALDLLGRPQMREAFALQIPAQGTRGQLDGRVSIALPLADQLTAKDIKTEIEANLTGVSMEKAFGPDKLENATLKLSGDNTGVTVKGEGRWTGSPVTIAFEKDSADGSTEAVLGLTLDDAGLARRGIDLGGAVRGTLPVTIRTNTAASANPQREGERKARIEVDLARAVLKPLVPGLGKPAGRPAKLSFDVAEKGRAFQLQNIAYDAGPVSMRGEALIEQDRGLRTGRFSLFRLSAGDNTRLEVERTPGQPAKITLRGNNFDARPFLRGEGDTDTGPETDVDLDLKTTLLSGFNGEVITNPELRLKRRGGQMREFVLTGRINGSALSARSTAPRSGGNLPVAVQIEDAGATLRFVDLYTRMRGGDLVGELVFAQGRTGGILLSRNFELRDEPAIRRLVAAEAGDAARRDVAFQKMRVEFQRDRNLVTIKDAVIFGPQIGLNFTGTVDQVRDRVSISGTYIPVYGLNNAFSQIPLVGTILGGGRNEGLLGITFSATGAFSKPTITINPLSAVAPGIFRKIFEFRNDASPALGAGTIDPARSQR